MILVAILLIWAIWLAIDGQPGAALVVFAISVSPIVVQVIGILLFGNGERWD